MFVHAMRQHDGEGIEQNIFFKIERTWRCASTVYEAEPHGEQIDSNRTHTHILQDAPTAKVNVCNPSAPAGRSNDWTWEVGRPPSIIQEWSVCAC